MPGHPGLSLLAFVRLSGLIHDDATGRGVEPAAFQYTPVGFDEGMGRRYYTDDGGTSVVTDGAAFA
jgi:hypothetical protein